MKIGGVYVGLGLGDQSEEVRRIRAFMRQKFSYAAGLRDHTLYDAPMTTAVAEMQKRYVAAGKLKPNAFTPGVINAETKYVMGYLTRPSKPKPVLFTVDGHMSRWDIGPAAEVGRILHTEGVVTWQGVGYNSTALPFDNDSGITELRRLLGDTRLLPAGTPWALACHSQGAIIGSEVWMQIRKPADPLYGRALDWRGTVAFGNPYRELDRVAEWVTQAPRQGTHGISPTRMTDTPTAWKEVAQRGDMYAEVTAGAQSTEHMQAIYLAVMNQWTGHPDSLLNQLVEVTERPIPELLAMFQAIVSGVLFVGNQAPHQNYDLRPCVDFLRRQLTR